VAKVKTAEPTLYIKYYNCIIKFLPIWFFVLPNWIMCFAKVVLQCVFMNLSCQDAAKLTFATVTVYHRIVTA
jgi:hypothetical protein